MSCAGDHPVGARPGADDVVTAAADHDVGAPEGHEHVVAGGSGQAVGPGGAEVRRRLPLTGHRVEADGRPRHRVLIGGVLQEGGVAVVDADGLTARSLPR